MRYKLLTITLALLALLTVACSQSPRYRTASGVVWTTDYHITYCAAEDLTDSITAAMRRVELSLSPFNDRSLVAAANRGECVRPDSLWMRVLRMSQRVCLLSGGRFDPTVGPLIEAWGFGRDKSVREAPTAGCIDSLLPRVGILECGVGPDGELVRKHPRTTFNFSAITKGLGCDEVADALMRSGATACMVEIGGELALRGESPRGAPWRIAVDKPSPSTLPGESAAAVVVLTDCGVATSGNYRNRRTYGEGRTAGHTIDPLTGHPVQTDVLSATVVAPDCMTADALATACMTMTADSALLLVERFPGCSALLLTADTMLVTADFPPLR